MTIHHTVEKTISGCFNQIRLADIFFGFKSCATNSRSLTLFNAAESLSVQSSRGFQDSCLAAESMISTLAATTHLFQLNLTADVKF